MNQAAKSLLPQILDHIKRTCHLGRSLNADDFSTFGDHATLQENLTTCIDLGLIVADAKITSLMGGDLVTITVFGLPSQGFDFHRHPKCLPRCPSERRAAYFLLAYKKTTTWRIGRNMTYCESGRKAIQYRDSRTPNGGRTT